MMQDSITRRNFVVGSMAAAACASASVALAEDVAQWDQEADVVVVGFGGAGGSAAMSAFDAGASVIVLEKMPFGGGDTEVSTGGFLNVTDPEAAFTYIKGVAAFTVSETDEDWMQLYLNESVGMTDWVLSFCPEGTELIEYGKAQYPSLEGADSVSKFKIYPQNNEPTSGIPLFEALRSNVEDQRQIPVLYNTPAKRLIVDNGVVVGVEAIQDSAIINVKANKGVILACGSYENNDTMKRNCLIGETRILGTPGNTGDGIRMAQKLGADIWHMNGAGGCAWGFECGEEHQAAARPAMPTGGFIWVDKTGKRFFNEEKMERHSAFLGVGIFDTVTMTYPRIPMYIVFDENNRAAGQLVDSKTGFFGLHEYTWSVDNMPEIEAGWILRADSIEELAQLINVSPENLAATIETWNASCESKEDSFGRDMDWGRPIAEPPFYAIPTYPATMGAQGGPKRNTSCQIMDVEGNPIPHLFSAGELGSQWGIMFQPGVAVGEALVTGRLAGKAAATME